ncbi:5-(carboxyamino)imidazole ribonucleotide synthase [Solicola gregarius]|uniref:N5-carboxyaminoimidazole ribonucleotide synthase n=1 Tax=Solicola gregarius TaxID=2908642 RepID=A0AA46TF01_9ACTN|nr:5-(carboxyamino)imidazole ribonucleotide synthase [Solicola gregarius]UYM04015.1 5-(carboxyamino)imidazole ribonucleotide synthase [Solicola gregarius]
MSEPTNPTDAPTLAVIGGGQLARMMQQAAVGLGVPIRLLAEGPGVSAAQVVRDPLVGDYRDLATLREVAADCAVVTFDHEHVPPEHLRALDAEGHACRPGPHALLYAQDKYEMRARLTELGAPCPRWALVDDVADVEKFAAVGDGLPVVLKTTRGGYDGKGVWFVRTPEDAAEAFASGARILAEERVDFVRELSALVARSPSGQVAAYPIVESRQRDGICHEVIAPAPAIDHNLAVEAQQLAIRIASELDVVGILAVEMFETSAGVLVNELAMRPHNTGHWSIDGAITSQFENHLRAVLDLPLGDPAPRSRWSVMVNILGGTVGRLYDGYPHVMARDSRIRVHLYGKSVRPGRKVGHVTAYGDDLEDVLTRARHAAGWFAGEIEEDA